MEIKPAVRKIIHIDMDAFYASVEELDRPELKGKPVVVGGSPESRAVVCAASYAVRKFGVRSAMSCSEAKRRCPQAIFIYPRFERYSEISDQIREVMETVTHKIEPLSLDEAYLDVTENLLGEKSATRIAQYLKAEIFKKTGLIASAGVSYNKFLAKIGSDLNKPNGLAVIPPEKCDEILLPLKVERLWGVGKKTAERLHEIQIHTVADIRERSKESLESSLGGLGEFLWDLSHGRDEREVEWEWDRKSYGSERTFNEDTMNLPFLIDELHELATEIAESIRDKNWFALTFTLKIKYFDFKQITRSITLPIPTHSPDVIFSELKKLLLEKTDAGRTPVRLIGVGASQFIRENDPLQLYFEFMNERPISRVRV